MLNIVATPIGNLKDITLRALEALKNADGIICEDTRRTRILLHHFGITKNLYVLNDFNEAKSFPVILQKLREGDNLALVSDAGTPLISDPGFKLVRALLQENIPVDSLPGSVAAVVALVASGLPPDKFFFLGYLPEKQGKRLQLLENLKLVNQSVLTTFIAYVAPHKLIRTLTDCQTAFGDIEIVLAKELTKIHQSVKSQKITTWLSEFKKQPPKGEYVLLFNLTSW